MELTAAQRRIVFALVVLVLAGLGAYLLTTTGHRTAASRAAQGGPAGQGAGGAAAPPASTPPAASAPVTSPPASPTVTTPTATRAPDIYQWLPFSKSGLASAASVAVKFGAAYGTFSYTEKTTAYVGSMRSLITPQLSGQISAAYAAPGVASLRARRKQVSAGSARITSLRAYGPSSLTFIVSVTEQITATKGGGPLTTSYAVTLTGGDTSWQVSGLEYEGAGNF
ncbi:MAG TPA: hypothetical protein VGG35_27700 [Streptosporangiaceae bacterium]|jgi:hypothetical protein